jgi:heme exporter protein D
MKEIIEMPRHTGPPGISKETIADFNIIKVRLEDCRHCIESLLPTVIGAFVLLEAQFAGLNTRLSSWLAVLATVFVPLRIPSGIFTLSGNYQPGNSKFWVYWTVAMPLLAVVFLIVLATMYYRTVLNSIGKRKVRVGRLRAKKRLKVEDDQCLASNAGDEV